MRMPVATECGETVFIITLAGPKIRGSIYFSRKTGRNSCTERARPAPSRLNNENISANLEIALG